MLFSLFSVLLCLLLAVPCASAQQPKLMARQTDEYFMTASALFLYTEENDESYFQKTWSLVKQTLGEIEQAVSVSIPESDIARFNALPCGEEIEVSPLTANILTIAKDVHALSGGLYDPTVYPLVDLWGFSPRFNQHFYTPVMPYDRTYENGLLPLPSASHIDALLPLVGLDGVALREENNRYYLKKNTPPVSIDGIAIQAQLDLGGIAKGYACDQVLALLRSRGHTMGHFVCGGSSMALLSRPQGDGTYTLTLHKPRPGQNTGSHFATLRTRDVTLSTSTDYNHSFMSDGVLYCHIIDPRTGYPINMPDADGVQQGVSAATLLYDSAAYGDALTTVLCVLGPEEAPAFLEQIPQSTAVLALYQSTSDTYPVISNAVPDTLTIDDPAYQLVTGQQAP